jgi:hypothetical protein
MWFLGVLGLVMAACRRGYLGVDVAVASVAACRSPLPHTFCIVYLQACLFHKTYTNNHHIALTKLSKGKGVSRTQADGAESPFGHHIVKAAMVAGQKSTTALPFAVFDIDDDEDETSGAGSGEPAAVVSLVVALGAAFVLL